MTIFLDLEGTVIDEWKSNSVLLRANVEKIRNFLIGLNIKEVNIFSAALYNQEEVKTFINRDKSWLENQLGIIINKIISVEEMVEQSKWHSVIFDAPWEALLMVGKERLFEDWCVANMTGKCILIDDSFEPRIVKYRNVEIEIKDIKEM